MCKNGDEQYNKILIDEVKASVVMLMRYCCFGGKIYINALPIRHDMILFCGFFNNNLQCVTKQ